MSIGNFWDLNVWGLLFLCATLLCSMLLANLLKKSIGFLKRSLIPTSVLGGIILLLISTIYKLITGEIFFNLPIFGGDGIAKLEIITYHGLAIGFIASTMRTTNKTKEKGRNREIFDTGCTTVATYLIQAILGLAITIPFALIVTGLIPASGVLLPFGYGQGTGQALNYGNIYQNDYGFLGGRSFGLTVAALGFLSASIGGVIYLNILQKKGKFKVNDEEVTKAINMEQVQGEDEVPMNGSMDKLSIQIGIVLGVYIVSFGIMYGLGELVNGVRSILFGFNFLIGVLMATLLKVLLKALRKKGVVKKQYVNSFLMNRISGFAFDLMIVAGIGAIQLDLIKDYWYVLIILGVVGALATFFYVKFVCHKLFPNYEYEEFFMMYGMLTGTASTGMILLREIDPEYQTPAADNLVFQNLPAIIFGFPMMLIAAYAPKYGQTSALITLAIVTGFFIVMNLILFRNQIFKKKNKAEVKEEPVQEEQTE